jgi:putative membrane protein
MKIKVLMLVAAFAIPTIASADDMKKAETTDKSKATAKLEAEDMKIVSHHHHVNMMEVDLGKLAQKQGSAKVKTYAAMIVKDHTAANKDLKALAKKKGIAKISAFVPETEAEKKEHDDAMAAMERIKTLKAVEFDREFLTMMVTDHDKLVSKTETQITAAKDPDLTAFLRKVKPTLQRHADKARELQKAPEISRK